jgi:hypothetical protein
MYTIINIPIINATFETNKQTNKTMAVSTVSTVNMYSLNKSGPSVPPPPDPYILKESDMNFPLSFSGLQAQFASNNTNDKRIPYTPATTGQTWRDQVGYELFASSTTLWQGTISNKFLQKAFDGITSNTFWGCGRSDSQASPQYLDGVNIGKYTQNPYQNVSPYSYIGGGNGFFYTTVHNQGSVSGEFFEFCFPFQVLLKKVKNAPRSALGQAPASYTVLCSDDRSTWTFIQAVTIPEAYSNGVFMEKTITTTEKGKYIRIVFTSTKSAVDLEVAEMQLIFDAYSIL